MEKLEKVNLLNKYIISLSMSLDNKYILLFSSTRIHKYSSFYLITLITQSFCLCHLIVSCFDFKSRLLLYLSNEQKFSTVAMITSLRFNISSSSVEEI
uniref:Uncharacterized protein n=1 Tax=Clostridioides difficile TaxID=1496 RepID=A0A2R4NC59_CLODI|nr:hypothetical protein plasmid_LIBA6289_00020 [Clostridioides difficile]